MIVVFIILILLMAGCMTGLVYAIKDREVGAALWLGICIGMLIFMEWVVIDANSKNNEALTEYRFPAAHYKLETMVTVKRCTVYVNGVETVGEERDTTYVLTGIEPIILENNHYDRKIVK